MKIIIFLACFSYVCVVNAVQNAHPAQTVYTETIGLFNNTPVMSLFGIVRPDFKPSKEPGSITLSSQFEITNYISSGLKDGDAFYIDGETWHFRNSLTYQWKENIQIAASLPWIRHSGGVTDNFIYSFHDLLQLPQNGRTQQNEDAIRWRLIRDGESLLRVDDNLSGWGDMTITAQLTPQDNASARWTFMTKLPTGSYDKQTGSERLDLGISFTEMNPEWLKQRDFLKDVQLAFWYGASLNYLGEVSALQKFDQYPLLATFRAGMAYAPWIYWHIKVQLDSQTPLYDTRIREFGWIPLIISFASMHQLGRDTQFEFAIIEDLRPRSAPDVILQTKLNITF